MLPREKRLVKKKDFEAVYQKGTVYYSEDGRIMVRCLKNTLNTIRIGFVIGKKFSPKAVIRNKAKRQLRAVFFENMKLIRPKTDIVVSLQKNNKDGNALIYKNLSKQVAGVIKKIK